MSMSRKDGPIDPLSECVNAGFIADSLCELAHNKASLADGCEGRISISADQLRRWAQFDRDSETTIRRLIEVIDQFRRNNP